MNVGDLRDMAKECHGRDEIVYEDADGNLHEVWTAVRIRYFGSNKIILRETTRNDFEFSVDKNPPQELIDRLEEYNERKERL